MSNPTTRELGQLGAVNKHRQDRNEYVRAHAPAVIAAAIRHSGTQNLSGMGLSSLVLALEKVFDHTAVTEGATSVVYPERLF